MPFSSYFVSVDPAKVYTQAPLAGYSFSERLKIRMADRAFYLLIRLIGSTLRFEVEGREHLDAIKGQGLVPIYCCWHDRIFTNTYFFRGQHIVIMTSQSLDGEYIARFIKRLGFGAVRGSSTRGGSTALVKMIRLMRNGLPVGFMADGPRGPRYKAKMGPVLLAKKTGNPMMPLVAECRRFWTIPSWDRLQIPVPFTRARIIMCESIYVKADASDEGLNRSLSALQHALDAAVVRGKEWRTKANN